MLQKNQQSLAGRVHPGVRILMLLVLSLAAFACPDPQGLALLALFAIVLAALCRVRPKELARLMLPAAPFLVMALLFGAFNYDPLADMVVTAQSAGKAVLTAARLLLLFAASALFCLTSTSSEQMTGLRTLLSPFARLGLPVDDAATTLSLALRFIPLTMEQLRQVRTAQKCRGARLDSGSMGARLRANAGSFVPLFVGMFRRAEVLSQAMDARCYGCAKERASLAQWRFGGADLVACALTLGVCAAALFVL